MAILGNLGGDAIRTSGFGQGKKGYKGKPNRCQSSMFRGVNNRDGDIDSNCDDNSPGRRNYHDNQWDRTLAQVNMTAQNSQSGLGWGYLEERYTDSEDDVYLYDLDINYDYRDAVSEEECDVYKTFRK